MSERTASQPTRKGTGARTPKGGKKAASKRSKKKTTSKKTTKKKASSKQRSGTKTTKKKPAKRTPSKKEAPTPGRCRHTGLPHGEAATILWSDAVADARGHGRPCALGLLDVDDFATHVEQLGPQRSDALLQAVATRLQDVLSDQALLARLAGDLFGVALPNVEVEPALGLLDRAREAVSDAPFKLGRGAKRRVVEATLSAGVAGLGRDADDATGLVEQARVALARAKGLGGNRLGLPARERMVLKTSYYPQSQLEAIKRLAGRQGVAEAVLLREALGDLLLKYKDRPPAGDGPAAQRGAGR